MWICSHGPPKVYQPWPPPTVTSFFSRSIVSQWPGRGLDCQEQKRNLKLYLAPHRERTGTRELILTNCLESFPSAWHQPATRNGCHCHCHAPLISKLLACLSLECTWPSLVKHVSGLLITGYAGRLPPAQMMFIDNKGPFWGLLNRDWSSLNLRLHGS